MATRRHLLTVIAAHPDDEVLSHGALLVKAKDEDFGIHILWLTKGRRSTSELAHTRWTEATEVARQLKATYESVDLKEGTFNYSELIPVVEARLRGLQSDVVAWPFGEEKNQHQDHLQLHAALMNISKRWTYHKACWLAGQTPVFDDQNFKPNLFLEFGTHRMAEVGELMKLYASEGNKQFAQPDFLRTRRRWAAYSGCLTCPNYKYAEPYMSIKGLPPRSLFWTRILHLVKEVKRSIGQFDKDQEAATMALIAQLDKPPSRSALRQSRIDTGMYRAAFTYNQTDTNIVFFRHKQEDLEYLIVVNVVLGKVTKDDIEKSRRRHSKWQKEVG